EELINPSIRGSSSTSSHSHVGRNQRKVPQTLPISRKARILNSLLDESSSDSSIEYGGPPVIVVTNPPLKSFKEAFFDTSPPPSPFEVETMAKCLEEKLKESPASSPITKTLASVNASEATLDAWELVMLSDTPSAQRPMDQKETDQELELFQPLTISDGVPPVKASTPTSEVPDLVRLSPPFPFLTSFDENHPDLQHVLSPSPSPPGQSMAGYPTFDVTVGANRFVPISNKNQQASAPLPDLLQSEPPKHPVSGDSDSEAKLKLDEQAKEQMGQPQAKKVTISEPAVVSDPDVKLLAQSLVEKFWEVERCIHEFPDMDGVYSRTRAIISETNVLVEQLKREMLNVNDADLRPASSDQSGGYPEENRMAICDRLMNKALLDNDDSDLDKIETFLDDSDCSLICDEVLAMRYASYEKEEQKINHFIEDLGLYLAAKNLGIVKPDSPRDKPNQGQSSLAEHSDEEVTFKRDSGRVKRRQGTALQPNPSSWEDKKMDCGTATASAPCSEIISPQTEHQYFNSDVTSNLLQGKDIMLYTEQELQQIDVNSLTEDETLLYAQALSQYEYLKETKTKAQSDDMEICDADDRPVADAVASQSSPTLGATDMDISPNSKPCTSSKQQSASPKNLKLVCDEDLGELDGIESKKDVRQSKGRSRWSGSRADNHPEYDWSELEPSILKYCDFCNKEFEDECISCSVLNQPVLDSSLMALSDKSSDSKTKASSKCNTPPDYNKILRPLNDKDTDIQPCASKSPTNVIQMSSPEAVKQTESSGDHVVPTCPAQPSPRKEKYLFSPSKPNNLTKSRDYSRLRSPSASPRKKNRPSRSSSASKRLLFSADEKCDKNESLMDDGPPFHNTSKDLDTSLEVNIGESSFDTREDSFMTLACSGSSRASQSPAGPSFSPLAKHSLNAPTTVITPKFSTSGKHGPHSTDTAHFSPSQVLQANQSLADPHARESRMSSNNSKNEQCSSKERFQENKSERMQPLGKSKSSWSSVNSNMGLSRTKKEINTRTAKAAAFRQVGHTQLKTKQNTSRNFHQFYFFLYL
ncbi:hypothetical protein Btru_005278, partial [Bulinus truncatus]